MSTALAPSHDIAVGANPFSRRSVLAIVLIGTLLFVALLWMIGTGAGMGSPNNGKAGLLVLTPPAFADGKEIEKIVSARRYTGPTLVILPKWIEMPPAKDQTEAKKGWVSLGGVQPPHWEGFLDTLSVRGSQFTKSEGPGRWHGVGLSGLLPDSKHIQSGGGTDLVQLIAGARDNITLAGFMDDGGYYPGLEPLARDRAAAIHNQTP